MSSSYARLSNWFLRTGRRSKGRFAATALLVLLVVLIGLPDFAPVRFARLELFDQYQHLSPRQARSNSVVIVEIDEATLGTLGQWPWPRHYLAALIDAMAKHRPSAIGLDMILPETDHASPQAIAESRPDLPPAVLAVLRKASSNDSLLAQSLSNAPTVLGAAAFGYRTTLSLDGLRIAPVLSPQGDPLPWINRYPYVLGSLAQFQMAAHGQALLSAEPERGVVRRMFGVSAINGTVTPGLSLEMLRVASNTSNIVLDVGPNGLTSARIGPWQVPLQENGEIWVHYDAPTRNRYISALSVLKGEDAAKDLSGKLVLLGLTGIGLQDMITTPLGDRRPGVEVHAQLLEAISDGGLLVRPWWMLLAEMGLVIILGGLLIWLLPNSGRGKAKQASATLAQDGAQTSPNEGIRPVTTLLLFLVMAVALLGLGLGLFRWSGWLFDALNPLLALALVLGSLFFSSVIEYEHQRKAALRGLQIQRIKAAQLAGELDAARRIQLGTLPIANQSFEGEARFRIAAMLEPARQVGGDLYDFFMIDEGRLFFVIGDVSGKGLPASLFMVVTKALAKSAALRHPGGVAEIVSLANTEMARENPEMLYVTVVAGILHVDTGVLELVNAGHDTPWLINAHMEINPIGSKGGPPLCVLDEFNYKPQQFQLSPGDTLLLFTDGITEAMNLHNEAYGDERLARALSRAAPGGAPQELMAQVSSDVREFVGPAESSDDLTLMLLQWQGPLERTGVQPKVAGNS
ncbi:MAG: hypothetical protein RL758_1913 [Pseudomonadota bacterium]